MSNMRSLPLCLLAGVVFSSAALLAQNAAPAARIVSPIDEGQLVTLTGNTNPHANAKFDTGPVSSDFSMPDLTLVLSRGTAQQAAFEAYVASEYDQNSPNFHQWLTPVQIGQRFGPAPSDIAAITTWLTGHGFVVRGIAPDQMTIRFAGTAGQVQSAFHTEIHNLSVNGASHYANMSDPQIPAALAPVVVGVKSLHNFLPHPLHKDLGKVQFNRDAGHWQRVATSTSTTTSSSNLAAKPADSLGVKPLYGINGTSNGSSYLEEDVSPWDFATIYNVIPAWNAGITGLNQTIAVAGTSLISQSPVGSQTYSGSGTEISESGTDVATFRSTFGLPALPSFQQIDTGDGPAATECTSRSPYSACGIGDLTENSLDVEWSGAVATGANLVLVVTGQNSAGSIDTVYDSAQYIVQNDFAKILNLSYGECELFQGTAQNVAFYDLWQSAAAEGISVFVAAGDSGSTSCDDGGDSIGWPYSAQYGLSVSGLASTPYNVAVGGTDFSWCKPVQSGSTITGCPTTSSGAGPYWNSSNNTSSEPYESATGYVPEIPWNATCTNPILANYLSSFMASLGYTGGSNPEATCNDVQTNWLNIADNTGNLLAIYIDTVGGSGGASNCVSNSTDPDSQSAGSCSTGANTTGTANGSITLYNNGWPKPSWQASVTGIPADGVRDLPDVSFFAGNGDLFSAYVYCVSELGACTYPSTTEESYEEAGGTSFASPAMSGVMALINQRAGSPQGLPTPELYHLASQQNYSNCSAESVSNTSGCYFQSIDQGTNAMPCDNGAALGGAQYYSYNNSYGPSTTYAGIVSPNCTALNSGDTVGTLTNPNVVSGANTTGEAYNATAGYNLATGLGSLNVYNVVNAWSSDHGTNSSSLGVVLNPTNGHVSAGSPLSITVTITGSGTIGTPTGNVTVVGGGAAGAQAVTQQSLGVGTATVTIPANTLAVGSYTLTIYYSGDSNYASSNTTATVVVAAITPSVVISAPATDNVANPVYVAVTVSGPTGAPTPAGSVSLDGSSAVTLSSTGTASFTIPANTLSVGSNTLTAQFNSSSASTYASGSGTTTINMVNTALLTPTIKITPLPASIDTGQSDTVTVTVTGSGPPPTGTVFLTGGTFSGSAALNGSATFTIPGNSLTAGTPTLNATYSGDADYATGSATNGGNLTVTASAYSLAASTPASVAPGSSTPSTITGSSTTDYTGTVTFGSGSCSLTNFPSNAVSLPSCSISGSITFISGTATGTPTATVYTTAAVAQMTPSARPGGKGWLGAGSGAVLALLFFFGVPKRRREWRALVGMIVLLVALGGLAACGSGGSSSSNGGGTGVSATTAGAYTFTVSGVGNDPAATRETGTFTVTVN